ncbi:MAG: hypothetical protein PHY39_02580 [Endomicrobiaceae bacterium]|nr:hypothetical protein [Endomicrobiaceae bacterium]
MAYECGNFIVNIFTAIGTCGAVIVALWLSRPKKEKATGYFEIQISDKEKLNTVVLGQSLVNMVSKKIVLNFWVNNIGNTNIIFNYKAGVYLKTKNDQEPIYLNNPNENDLFIPKKTKDRFFIYILNLQNEKVLNLYKDKNCVLVVYTIEGNEIELKKK